MARLGVPLLLVPGAGVLSDQGEIERDSAAATLVWGGGHAQPVAVSGPSASDAADELARALKESSAKAASAVAIPDSPLRRWCSAPG